MFARVTLVVAENVDRFRNYFLKTATLVSVQLIARLEHLPQVDDALVTRQLLAVIQFLAEDAHGDALGVGLAHAGAALPVGA